MIIYIMGVAGSGKSAVGKALGNALNATFLDGDDFHPPENISKMNAGQALHDEDRKGWLFNIRQSALEHESRQETVIIACSALKQAYRDLLQQEMGQASIYWVFLDGSYELILERMKKRQGHFMPPSLLQSQFDTLERPTDAIRVDITKPITEIVNQILSHISKQ
jgi:gluconokinase